MGKFSELKDNISNNKKGIGIWLALLSLLSVSGFQSYQNMTTENKLRQNESQYLEVGELSSPSFVGFNPDVSEEEESSLEDSARREFSEGTIEDNVCRLYRKERPIDRSYNGNCIFLTKEWVLTAYHLLRSNHSDSFSRDRTLSLVTSYGKSLTSHLGHDDNINVVTISPRKDLALLMVRNNPLDIKPLAIGNALEESEDLMYTFLRNVSPLRLSVTNSVDEVNPYIISVPVGSYTFNEEPLHYNNGVYKGTLAEFNSYLPFIKHNSSGMPIHDRDNRVLGIFVSGNETNNTFYFSPYVRDFIEESLDFIKE